ncbi:MAG: C-terminal binding protein [Alkalispirochaeta sp.]
MPTVLVTDDRHTDYTIEAEILRAAGIELEVHDFTSLADAIPHLQRADGLLLNLFPLDRLAIRELKRCRVISRYGTGYDNVDVSAATEAGIWVARVPDYATEDASDHALALLLAAARQVTHRDRAIRSGSWNAPPVAPVRRIAGSTLGIAGLGRVGKAVIRKSAGLGFHRVLVYDPHKSAATVTSHGARQVDLETLIRESDFLSWHVPLTDETRGLVGRREFELVKPEAVWVNTARGAIFDEAALAEALARGRPAYAGLDVFDTEPLPADSPLRTLDNVLLTDHFGYFSRQSIVDLKTQAAENVVEVLAGRAPVHAVNYPLHDSPPVE